VRTSITFSYTYSEQQKDALTNKIDELKENESLKLMSYKEYLDFKLDRFIKEKDTVDEK